MPFTKANTLNLYYEIHGTGAPLVLISGFTQSLQGWKQCIPYLSQHFQVISFDNRGVGQSDSPDENYSIETFAEDTLALLNALNIESAHFMGHSMGTLIVQQLCISHPDRVKKAVLCAPFAKLPNTTKHNLRSQLKLLAKGTHQSDLLELDLAWLFSNRFLENPKNIESFLQEMAQNPYPQSLEGLLGQAAALLQADLSQRLKSIPHETLLLAGEQDLNTPVYCAQQMHAKIPHSKLHIFKEMAHMIDHEIPEKLSKKALEFLLQN